MFRLWCILIEFEIIGILNEWLAAGSETTGRDVDVDGNDPVKSGDDDDDVAEDDVDDDAAAAFNTCATVRGPLLLGSSSFAFSLNDGINGTLAHGGVGDVVVVADAAAEADDTGADAGVVAPTPTAAGW